jgi:hypothetical protein
VAITLAQAIVHKTRTTFPNTTTQLINGVAAGSLLVAPIAYYHGQGRTITITSSPSNSWQQAVIANGDANSHIAIIYALNVASGNTTLTYTWSAGSLDGQLEGDILEFSSAATAAGLDANVTNSGSSSGPSVTSGTLAQADEVVIAMGSHTGNDTTWAVDTADSYTEISENEDNDNGQTYSSQYKIVAATTSQVVNFTLGASRSWFACLASFKGAAAAAEKLASVMRAPVAMMRAAYF